MPTPVKMPRLGESVAEGTIGGWLKQEGDWVERDKSLAEIITDKINAELPSPVEGRLVKILVQTDETVPVGTDIALIEADVSASATPEPAATPAPEAQRSASPAASENGAARMSAPMHKHEEERQRISPLARRLAREHELDLNAIPGTGAGGRVRKEDILAYIAQRPAPALVAAVPAVARLLSRHMRRARTRRYSRLAVCAWLSLSTWCAANALRRTPPPWSRWI